MGSVSQKIYVYQCKYVSRVIPPLIEGCLYFQGKQNGRLDHLFNILLRVDRDKAFERFQKLHKGRNTHRMSEIQRRHKLGSEMLATQTPHEISQTSWTVKSQQEPDKEYTVNLVLE